MLAIFGTILSSTLLFVPWLVWTFRGVTHIVGYPAHPGLTFCFCPLGVFPIMSLSHMGRSAALKVDCFAENVRNCDRAKSIVDHFAGQNIKILSIQQCSKKIARVTFEVRATCECVQKVAVVPLPLPQIEFITSLLTLLMPTSLMHWAVMARFRVCASSIGHRYP